MKIIREAKKLLVTQDYRPQRSIDGVFLVEIKRFVSEDGDFWEVVRIKNGKIIQPKELSFFTVKQINYSQILPGTIKAWHLHFHQDEIWFVPPEGRLIVGLLDLRENSRTRRLTMRLVLGVRSCLLYIPRGVAHGLANPYLSSVRMTYLVNNYFDGKDEKRLPYDFAVEENFWAVQRG